MPTKNLVFLHGYGGGGGMDKFLSQGCKADINWLSPASPRKLNGSVDDDARAWWYWDLPMMERRLLDGHKWADAIDPLVVPRGMPASSDAVLRYVESLEGGMTNTILAGLSQGATAALDAALVAPDRPSALVIMSPAIVAVKEWLELADGLKDVPILITHGRKDGTLPVAGSQWLADTLDEAGASVTLVTFRGGHEMPPLRLLHSWLESLK